ncbi:hypothetical protein E2320_021547 [Naja naja]|nr:hypothetical protein E2320_021547 [Naja naja]
MLLTCQKSPAKEKKSLFSEFLWYYGFRHRNRSVIPQTVKAVSWENLQDVLSNHFSPKPSHIARRLAFRRRAQAEGETISSHMAALRTAALHYGFRDLDDMLLDQLVYGMRDLQLQHRLLSRSNLTLKVAIEESLPAKKSTLSAAEIQNSNPHTVNPAAAKASVHHEDVVSDGIVTEEEDIHRLKDNIQLKSVSDAKFLLIQMSAENDKSTEISFDSNYKLQTAIIQGP